MKRLLLAAALIFVAGCEQTKPPTPEGLKKIAERTGKGTIFTKLEARSQPDIPRAGEVSIWALKVFNIKDKEDGTRQEWKFYDQLPQVEGANTSEVLMNAWLISRDGSVFLPTRPAYKEYGSFVTDWTIPHPGRYTLYTEYRPDTESGAKLPKEMAHWEFTADPGKTGEKPLSAQPHWGASKNPAPITLNGAPDGEPAGTLSLVGLPSKAGDTSLVIVKGAPDGSTGMEIAAVSAGGDFQHFTPDDNGSFAVSFPKGGMMRIWAYFTLNGATYAAPINHFVGDADSA